MSEILRSVRTDSAWGLTMPWTLSSLTGTLRSLCMGFTSNKQPWYRLGFGISEIQIHCNLKYSYKYKHRWQDAPVGWLSTTSGNTTLMTPLAWRLTWLTRPNVTPWSCDSSPSQFWCSCIVLVIECVVCVVWLNVAKFQLKIYQEMSRKIYVEINL